MPETAPDGLRRILKNAAAAADDLLGEQPERRRQLLHFLIHRVTLYAGTIRIEIKRLPLNTLVSGNSPGGTGHTRARMERQEDLIDLIAHFA